MALDLSLAQINSSGQMKDTLRNQPQEFPLKNVKIGRKFFTYEISFDLIAFYCAKSK